MDHPFPTFPCIAVIEDDEDLRANLLLTLRSKNYPTWGAASAEEFYRERAVSPADIVLVDLGLPGEDGLSALRHLRQNGNLGIIVVTARGGSENRIAGLEAGADHYFIKPVDTRELLAAIESLWRRMVARSAATEGAKNSTPLASADNWVLEPTAQTLNLPDGRKIKFSERECNLLACLMGAQGLVVGKAALHAAIFPEAEEIDLHRVDVIVSRLRQKSESLLGSPLPIRTIFGKGFVLVSKNQMRGSDSR
ncbi:response regulator transcription factor [Quatrionicoccus australiensis]|uniref:response regulator transcription factor n=1 Tax=Quatrionicoccus australiensis TaxID=138118 RepID=UPI001CF976FA|nr:response regulator transcription factor [Quatrionicoccus australiensis]MCB4361071.1 response regulator transcription factor [Quatrionicoccus australiensis]